MLIIAESVVKTFQAKAKRKTCVRRRHGRVYLEYGSAQSTLDRETVRSDQIICVKS